MVRTIGLLFETQADILAAPNATAATHYHWREPAEVEAVATSLTAQGFQVDSIGPLGNLLQRWQEGALPDFVWNLSVRARSRNRTALAPALLEQLELPYTGGDAAAKSLTLNKDWLKPVLQWCGVQTPPWRRYAPGMDVTELPPWPVSILKPACEGYSLGLVRVDTAANLAALQAQVRALHAQFGLPLLCEPLIVGREITVGVVGHPEPALLGAVETVTATGDRLGARVLDLTAKRQGGFAKVKADLTDPALVELATAAQTLMAVLGPLDYATFDFRLDATGQAYLLDVNADATLHPERSLARIAIAQGWTYTDLITAILQTARQRWHI